MFYFFRKIKNEDNCWNVFGQLIYRFLLNIIKPSISTSITLLCILYQCYMWLLEKLLRMEQGNGHENGKPILSRFRFASLTNSEKHESNFKPLSASHFNKFPKGGKRSRTSLALLYYPVRQQHLSGSVTFTHSTLLNWSDFPAICRCRIIYQIDLKNDILFKCAV